MPWYQLNFKSILPLILLFCCILFSISPNELNAQKLTISGSILDENSKTFPGVQVDLHQSNMIMQSDRADQEGKFTFTNLISGEYFLVIQFLGYENDTIPISLKNTNLILNPVSLRITNKNLKEVVIREKKPIGSVANDTLQFNASSFKVMKDASADELIEKMPTVTKDQGTIKAQGEDVKQVLVDGKPFFGNDPNLSLKSLPAEIIDKIQIFDQLSEQSQFTGINDGNTVKTINIVTKSGLNNGQFGKLYAGYGNNDKYQAGGNFNYFDGDRRISLIGMSNNINIQNFSIDDILGVIGSGNSQRPRNNFGNQPRGGNDPRRDNRGNSSGPGDFLVSQNNGISKTHAFGINFSDKVGSKLDYSVSYFFNRTNTQVTSELSRQYFQTDTLNQNYTETNNSTGTNTNHRLNARLEYKLDSFNSIVFRPRLTLQSNSNNNNSDNKTTFNLVTANSSNSQNDLKSDGINLSNYLLFRHKFKKFGRTISLDLNSNYAPKDDDNRHSSFASYVVSNTTTLDTILQSQSNSYHKWGYNTSMEYTEPINPLHSISLNYRYNYGLDKTELNTYDIINESTGTDTLNLSLSNNFQSRSATHQAGLGYQFNKEQRWNVSIRTNWQYAKVENQEYFPQTNSIEKKYYNFLPSLFLRYSPSKTKSLFIQYRASTQIPSISQLQNILNNSNPIQLSIGNPALKQSVNQNANIRYSNTSPAASIFFGMLGFTMTNDYITNHLYINSRNNPVFNLYHIANGVQLSIPENAQTSYQFRSFISYTIPITKIKCNISFDASYVYSETPGLLDTLQFRSFQKNTSFGIALTSNISQAIDFNIQFRPSYNTAKSIDTKSNYFILDQRVKFNWQFISKNILRIEFNSKINQDLSRQYNQNIYLLNLAIGRKLFKNERGEIAIGVNDLLNQNQSIQRSISEYYIEDSKSNTLQRFFMLSFTYNIRNYNSGKKTTSNNNPDAEHMRRWRD
jgi:hypothetical protein